MKNLIDELHSIDKEEFSVSPSFSKNVMKNIKLNKKLVSFTRVVSMLSCACLLFMCVYFANKTGILDKVVNNFSQKDATESSSIDAQTQGKVFDSYNAIEEAPASYYDETPVEESMKLREPAVNSAAVLSSPQESLKENNVNDISIAETSADSVEEELEDKRYIKKIVVNEEFLREDYLTEIENTLKENNFECTAEEEGIVVNSNDVETIKNLLADFEDVEVNVENGKTIITLK